MASLKNWDNKTWLSSKQYIQSFNNFILKQKKLNKYSKVLDIGCGRGKIIGNLSERFNFIKKPIGLDIENHKDRSKKIIFKKLDALSYVTKTKENFDLILIKQTIHLLKKNQIKRLLSICRNKLSPKGKIMILSLDPKENEIPGFSLMNNKLKKSLKRDKEIFSLITKIYSGVIIRYFSFNVKILKINYLKMIKNRYISTLLTVNEKQLRIGINEIRSKYKKQLKFKDKLICFIIKK